MGADRTLTQAAAPVRECKMTPADKSRRIAKWLSSSLAAGMLAIIIPVAGIAEAQGDTQTNEHESKRLCELNHVPACKSYAAGMAMSVFYGSADAARKQIWAYGRACELGDGESCKELGDAQMPIGLFAAPKDVQSWEGTEAAYRTACDEYDIVGACTSLGQLLSHERNPGRDAQASIAYYGKACDLGNPDACQRVGKEPPPTPPPPAPAPSAATATPSASQDEPTDGLVQVSEDLLAGLIEIKAANRGSSVLKPADMEPLTQLLYTDGQIDANERELLLELTHPYLRAIRIYPLGQDNPWGEAGTGFSTLSSQNRAVLLPLLEPGASSLDWNEDDRQASLRNLALSSQQVQALRTPAQAIIASKVKDAASISTVENGYGPFRDLVSQMLASVQTMEKAGMIDTRQGASARQLFYDSVEDGISASGADIPRFLYNWLDTDLGLEGPNLD